MPSASGRRPQRAERQCFAEQERQLADRDLRERTHRKQERSDLRDRSEVADREPVERPRGARGAEHLGHLDAEQSRDRSEDRAVTQGPVPAVPLTVPEGQPVAVEQADPIDVGGHVTASPTGDRRGERKRAGNERNDGGLPPLVGALRVRRRDAAM